MSPKLIAIPAVLLRSIAAAALAAAGFGANAGAEEADPYLMADDTWITLSGEVVSVDPDSFLLDYGGGYVVVEMDDGDRDADAYKLRKGEKVTVAGQIDDDFFEATKIEASSVYVESIGTTFFASAIDKETSERFAVTARTPVIVAETVVQGTVTEVDADAFTLDAGLRSLRVDVTGLAYDPLDDEGYQKIDVGDRVKVMGEIDSNLFEGRELVADSVIKLNR